MQLLVFIHCILIIRLVVSIVLDIEAYKLITCLLQFWCHYILIACNIDCEADQSWWNINIIEGTRHRILTSDRRKSKSHLYIIRTKQCGKWQPPTIWIGTKSLKILLECQSYLAYITTGCSNLCNGSQYRIDGSMIWAPA